VTLPRFDYIAPLTVGSAVSALQVPGSVAIAGGHHLLTLLKRRELEVRRLVDLRGLTELRGISQDPEGGVRVGALTTLTELLTDPRTCGDGRTGALEDAVSALGDRQSRNRVTLGGQLACGRIGNDLAAALMVLDTTVSLTGPAGERVVPLNDLWDDGPDVALAPGELITGAVLAPPQGGSGYARMAHPATLEASCGVAVAVDLGPGGLVADCRIAAVGATLRPGRIAEMEQAVIGTDGSREPAMHGVDASFVDDRFASGAYRRHLTPVLAGRALTLALDRTRSSVNS
jgi:carbon-monoxide dehydrogenase medium subunit